MEKDWVKINTYTNAVECEIVRLMLEEQGIPAVALNKQDSSYLFGKIELYVQDIWAVEAKKLITNSAEEA